MSRSYKESPRKWLYRWIAIKHFTTPRHVYNLAHGYYPLRRDTGVVKDLVKYGILRNAKSEGAGK